MEDKLEELFKDIESMKIIHKASLVYQSESLAYSKTYNMGLDEGFIGASTGKLFTTAAILSLATKGLISLEDHVGEYLKEKPMEPLKKIRIKSLLYQNAGLRGSQDHLPMSKRLALDPPSIEEDLAFSLGLASWQGGREGASYYSSVNFHILGKVLESALARDLRHVYQDLVFSKAGMTSTYLAEEGSSLPGAYFKMNPIKPGPRIRKAGAAGGFITTSLDLMNFIRAFHSSKLFDYSYIEKSNYYPLQKSFGSLAYGLGHMKLDLGQTYFLGHNGISGAYCFYQPEKKIYISGSLNQFADQGLTVRLLERLARDIFS